MRSHTLLVLTLFAALRLSAREVDVRPAPAWTERAEIDTTLTVARQNVRWGIYDILSDHQVRVSGSAESQYFRTVRKVLSPSGVQNASELSLDFDPSFQKLTLHEITLVRGAARIDALDIDAVRVIDKEDDADSRIYDGERTALVFIKDVRAGDVIDYSWSLDGANPILHGKYTDEYDLSSAVPERRMRHRLLWPAGRPLQWRGANPEISVAGDEQILVWQRTNVPPLDVEDSVPSWFEPWQAVQVTEFASWNEVAGWSDAMFQLDARSSLAVKELAARIFGEHATRDERVTAAIRFVQDDIRYLGIEMGPSSHQPHQPWETLESRWGDCKDKTLLLVALLRELGLEAWPALVNTRLQNGLTEKLPSPFLFDHVIAQVIVAGKTYWVDGTISDQGGTLAAIDTPGDGQALIVRASTTALTPIAGPARSAIEVDQTYTTKDYAKPTILEVRTTYRGDRADGMRSRLASMSVEDFAHQRINSLAMDQPKIEADGAPRIDDDRLGNVIAITEKYRLPELWADGDWTWYPRVLEAHLRRPDTMIRAMPLAFDYPLAVTQTVKFHFPENVDIDQSTSVTETPTFRYEYTVDSSGNTVWIRQSLHARRDVVEVAAVADHLTKLNAIWSEIGYRLVPEGAQAKPAAEQSASGYKWAFGLVMVTLFVAMCFFLATRRRPPSLIAIPAFLPGEAPVSAVAVRGASEITDHLAALRCPCGAALDSPPDTQHARYGEREMTIVTRRCETCGREQSVYFTAA